MQRKILILGGDKRSIYLANGMCKDGENISVFGFDDVSVFNKNITIKDNLSDAISDADYVITGVPTSKDEITLNTPLYKEKIYMYTFFEMAKGDRVILGAGLSQRIKHMADVYEVDMCDYLKREELAVLNTIPTVEGAIETAMRETEHTIHSSQCLVLGFGRIGKLLSKMLSNMGAKVTSQARKAHDLAWIDALGYNKTDIKDVHYNLDRYDIIFNTIPSEIFKEKDYKYMKKGCLLIDLASLPGGFNSHYAQKYGIRLVRALSLPGKCAPLSAAEYIKETIENMIDEMEF